MGCSGGGSPKLGSGEAGSDLAFPLAFCLLVPVPTLRGTEAGLDVALRFTQAGPE